MTKTKNRFSSKEIITCHDNILADLFKLNLESNITYSVINNEEYLLNTSSGRNYQVGLRVKIPKNLLTNNGYLKKYSELAIDEQHEIFDKLKDKLFFTNVEILFTNILLDKFLNNVNDFEISFKQIEGYYRKKVISFKNVVLNDLTYNRYLSTINSLLQKEVFLITKANFREPKYGVNNRFITQPLLTIINQYYSGKNNLVFSYSFGNFGNVLKLSRRYSNNLISQNYRFSFNQAIKHSIAYFIGQQIFIARNRLNRNPLSSSCMRFNLNINSILQSIHYESRTSDNMGLSISSKLEGFKSQPNKNRTYRMIIKYINELLGGFCTNESIFSYKIIYYYDETESFAEKHEFDYEIDGNLNYEFSVDDINQDVNISIIIYLENPTVIQNQYIK